MSRNVFATVDDVEKLTGRKSAPILVSNLRKIGRGLRQRICLWAISLAVDAMTTCAIGFICRLANVLGLLGERETGSGSQRGTK
jgi:hypothetical protein